MATELLASGIAEADSNAVTLADGARAVLFLTGPAAQGATFSGSVAIQFQTAGSGWSTVYLMDGTRRTARVDGPTTFRVRRPARDERSLAVGVDRA